MGKGLGERKVGEGGKGKKGRRKERKRSWEKGYKRKGLRVRESRRGKGNT